MSATTDGAAPRLTPKGRATRARIVAAAAGLMFEHGVAGTSTEDVIGAAGVSSSQHSGVLLVFNKLTTQLGLRTPTVGPRIHDLRHSFAVRTLLNWHRAGVDVNGRMAMLSVYLGHTNPAGTYWYLSAAPELMELVATGLDTRTGGRR